MFYGYKLKCMRIYVYIHIWGGGVPFSLRKSVTAHELFFHTDSLSRLCNLLYSKLISRIARCNTQRKHPRQIYKLH